MIHPTSGGTFLKGHRHEGKQLLRAENLSTMSPCISFKLPIEELCVSKIPQKQGLSILLHERPGIPWGRLGQYALLRRKTVASKTSLVRIVRQVW